MTRAFIPLLACSAAVRRALQQADPAKGLSGHAALHHHDASLALQLLLRSHRVPCFARRHLARADFSDIQDDAAIPADLSLLSEYSRVGLRGVAAESRSHLYAAVFDRLRRHPASAYVPDISDDDSRLLHSASCGAIFADAADCAMPADLRVLSQYADHPHGEVASGRVSLRGLVPAMSDLSSVFGHAAHSPRYTAVFDRHLADVEAFFLHHFADLSEDDVYLLLRYITWGRSSTDLANFSEAFDSAILADLSFSAVSGDYPLFEASSGRVGVRGLVHQLPDLSSVDASSYPRRTAFDSTNYTLFGPVGLRSIQPNVPALKVLTRRYHGPAVQGCWTPWKLKEPQLCQPVENIIKLLKETNLSPEEVLKLKRAFNDKYYPSLKLSEVVEMILEQTQNKEDLLEVLKAVHRKISALKDPDPNYALIDTKIEIGFGKVDEIHQMVTEIRGVMKKKPWGTFSVLGRNVDLPSKILKWLGKFVKFIIEIRD